MSKINILKKACMIGGLSMAAFTFAACGGNAVLWLEHGRRSQAERQEH